MKLPALALVAIAACSARDDGAPRVSHEPLTPPASAPDAAPLAARPPRQPDVMPSGADPMYPTPRRAGTEDLFLIEEPVRGPHVTQLAMPDRGKLAFDLRAYCEIDELTVVCGHDRPAAKDLASVSVGMDHGRIVLVEWKLGQHVDQTVVLSYNAAGAIERMARLDATGTIDWVRTYAPAGKRYTARSLDGENALPGCGAIELTIDNGRATAKTCLQWLGDEMRDTNGVVSTEFERDQDGFVITERRLGFGGRMVEGQRDLVHQIDTTRDRRGRPTRERYLAVAGHPIGSAPQHGCVGIDLAYANNVEVQRTCVDAAGAPAGDEDGVYVVETEHDRNGCAITTRDLDGRGRPAGRDGVHELRDAVDDRCQVTATGCWDVTGARIACGPGEPAEYRYVLDAHGWITSTTYVGTDGLPSFDPNYGASEVRQVYDDLGRKLEEACFDASGGAIECGTTGFHRMVDVYNANGLSTEERFYAADGAATTNMGTSVRRFIYDNYDHLSESRDYDAIGNLFEVQGMAIKRSYYDDSHRLFGIVLLDARGDPANYTSCYVGVYCPGNATVPWHAVRLVRSPTGRVITNLYFDAAGQPLETVDCKVQQCWTD